jgi:hypothetical protein
MMNTATLPQVDLKHRYRVLKFEREDDSWMEFPYYT